MDPADPALRTFKIVRKPADGLAYASQSRRNTGSPMTAIKDRIAGKYMSHEGLSACTETAILNSSRASYQIEAA